MRLSVVLLAAAVGSLTSIASAQFTQSTPVQSKGLTTSVAPPSGGRLLVGGADDCANADVIVGTGSYFFDNSLATTGLEGQSESICYEFGTVAMITDVWFDWTADFDGTAKVDTCGSPTDTKVAAYPGAGCPTTGTALDCNDDSCGWQSEIYFPVVNGQTYAIQVGLYPFASGGTGMLNIAPAPVAGCPVMHSGVSDNSIGLTYGGDTCYMYYVDCMTTIDTIEAAYGTPAFPGGIANGSPVTLAVWDDPTNDAEPSDAVLLTTISVPAGVTNADTDILNVYPTGGIAVTGGTWIGVVVTQIAGEYPATLDGSSGGFLLNWVAGATTASGVPFDYNNIMLNDVTPAELGSIGFAGAWLMQVSGSMVGAQPGVPYCPGDGTYAACPCGNNNDGSMSGCDWMGGGTAGAELTAVGSNDMAAADTYLVANNVSADFGVFFGADNQVAGVLNDGIRCAGGGLVRLIPPTNPGGNTATHTVPLQVLDPTAAPGVTRNYQYWFRTPGGPCGTTANTSNGYSIDWM